MRILGLLCSVVVLALTGTFATAAPIEIGTAVADFELETLDGGRLSLSGRGDGSPVVLVFFRGAW